MDIATFALGVLAALWRSFEQWNLLADDRGAASLTSVRNVSTGRNTVLTIR